jgi:hypothetical protein
MATKKKEESKAITLQEKINTDIQKYSITDQKIAEIKTYKNLKVNGVDDSEGLKLVHARRMEVRALRVGVEKKRKELKFEAKTYAEAIDAEATRIKSAFEDVEEYLLEIEENIENEKERIKQEELRKEEQKIQDRIKILFDFGMNFNGETYQLGDVKTNNFALRYKTDEEFNLFIDDLKIAFDEQNRIMEEDRLKREEEERIENEKRKEEEERVRKLIEENEARKKEQEAERKRLDEIEAEQKARAKRLQEEEDRINREKLETLQKRAKLRQDILKGLNMIADKSLESFHYNYTGAIKFDQVLNMEDSEWETSLITIKEVIAKKKHDEEEQRNKEIAEAQQKAVAEALEKKKKEDEAAAERKRIADEAAELEKKREAEIAPDREKLLKYCEGIEILVMEKPTLKTKRAADTLDDIQKELLGSTQRIRNLIKRIK